MIPRDSKHWFVERYTHFVIILPTGERRSLSNLSPRCDAEGIQRQWGGEIIEETLWSSHCYVDGATHGKLFQTIEEAHQHCIAANEREEQRELESAEYAAYSEDTARQSEIFIRAPKSKREAAGGAERQRGFNSIPARDGFEVSFKPYGWAGIGYYYVKAEMVTA